MIKLAKNYRIERLLQRALKLGIHIASASIILILTYAQPIGGSAPFAAAFMAAAIFQNLHPAPLIIGAALGCLRFPFEPISLEPLIACALIPLIKLGATRLKLLTRPGLSDMCCALFAGIAVILSQLPFIAFDSYTILMAFLSAAIAAAAAPTLIAALGIGPDRTRLSRDERISIVLLALAAIMGLYRIPLIGPEIAMLAASLIALAGALCSVGTGAVAGILSGTVLIIMGATPTAGAALALCAIAAGAMRNLGRSAMSLGFLAANAVAMLYTGDTRTFIINPYIALLAGVLICFTPPRLEAMLLSFFAANSGAPTPGQIALHLRGDAEARLRALGSLFLELSVGYDSQIPAPDETALISTMRQKLCEDCGGYEKCWGGNSARASRLLVGLMTDAMCGQIVDATLEELPPDICRKCRRANHIPSKLGPMLQDFDERRRAARERGECKALLASQFHMAGEALMDESDRLARSAEWNQELGELAVASLDSDGLEADGVWATDDLMPTLFVSLKDRQWSPGAVELAQDSLSRALGISMRAARQITPDGEALFTPAPCLCVDVGFAGRSSQVGSESGDSHLAAELSDSRVLLALSDGMGSGVRARQESTSALRLLKQFLSAGVPCGMALDAINELMILRSQDEMFATIDLCMIDLMNSRADFVKLGSCQTIILRGNKWHIIDGGQLPIGVLNKVVPAEKTVRLQAGDLIVMVTDGVLDGTNDGDMEWLMSVIKRHKDDPPQKICERIVSLAAKRSDAKKDDMTALTARISAP